MTLTELVQACEFHQPAAIVLAPDDFAQVTEFAKRATPGDWLSLAGEILTYRGAPVVRSVCWGRSYLVEDTSGGPMIHMIG